MKKDGKIRVGISACLLGEKVRFDSGHKHDRYLTDTLGQFFSFVPVCPEIEVGMGVPRETVNLQGSVESPSMIGTKSGKDWTEQMRTFSRKRTEQLEKYRLRGYILKKDSPSCGMERVKLYPGPKSTPERKARGLYADALIRRYPLLPVEEEGRLHDIKIRENFIVRVFAYDRVQNLFENGYQRKDVMEFHTVHKYLLLAHSPKHYSQLGKIVAAIKEYKAEEFAKIYSEMFMDALGFKSTVAKNVNVMQHIMGFLKKHLDAEDRKYILNIIEDYRNELVPLIVPITLIKQFIDKYQIDYIRNQYYLNPHPRELMLRNHV